MISWKKATRSIIDTKSSKKDKRIFGLDYHQIRENGKRSKEKVLHYHARHLIYDKLGDR